MQIENPWIAIRCNQANLQRNRLPTFLQEQYGQLGEDLILEAVLKTHFKSMGLKPQAIRYAEVGANHPIQTSNTYLFAAKWGGSGLLVEANPQLVDALRQARPRDEVLNLAVVPPGYPASVAIKIAKNAELSSVNAQHIASFGAIGEVAGEVTMPTVTLDTLLNRYFQGGIHLLSVDIEGLDLEVIEKSALAVRPTFIVTEPSSHFHATAEQDFARVMAAKGYVEIARTDYNLIFGDPRQLRACAQAAASTHAKRKVKTFDIFDTLLARRCMHPHQIHVQVEQASGERGFAQDRVQAEAAVEHREYGLNDIYEQLVQHRQWTAQRAQEMMALELKTELDNVIPIAEGLERLDRESVLVSDMYLPEHAIRAMLKRAGVKFELPLIKSNAGKRTGRVWQDLAQRGWACEHLGDNLQADVESARRHGMAAEHLTLATPTVLEQELFVAGCRATAGLLRELRLAVRATGLPDWLQTLQFELNVPLLLISSAYLVGLRCASQVDRLLFASRDCRHLQVLHEAMSASLGLEPQPSHYWYTSRLARTSSSQDYLDYCRELMGPKSMVVDLCGTGVSLAKLFARMQMTQPPAVLLIERLEDRDYIHQTMLDHGLQQANLAMGSLFSDSEFCSNVALELLNLTPEGMVRDVERVVGGYVPVREASEFTGPQAEFVGLQSDMITRVAQALRATDATATFVEMSNHLEKVKQVLRQRASQLQAPIAQLRAFLGEEHAKHDAQILGQIRRSRGQ